MRIAIDTSNAAFGDTPLSKQIEVLRILQQVHDKLAVERSLPAEGESFQLFDSNGNSVGICSFTPWPNPDEIELAAILARRK